MCLNEEQTKRRNKIIEMAVKLLMHLERRNENNGVI